MRRMNTPSAAVEAVAFPHLLRNIQTTWREAGCVQYLHSLLTDNRQGTRSGFSQSVAEELLLLIAMLSEQG